MRIRDWSSDVCSSDLRRHAPYQGQAHAHGRLDQEAHGEEAFPARLRRTRQQARAHRLGRVDPEGSLPALCADGLINTEHPNWQWQRSEEHTSELQSLMRISYAVFCLKKKNKTKTHRQKYNNKEKQI